MNDDECYYPLSSSYVSSALQECSSEWTIEELKEIVNDTGLFTNEQFIRLHVQKCTSSSVRMACAVVEAH